MHCYAEKSVGISMYREDRGYCLWGKRLGIATGKRAWAFERSEGIVIG